MSSFPTPCSQGPTLALRIKGYSLARDVQSAQARPRAPPNAFQTPPLVVLNGFGGSGQAPQPEHLKLATVSRAIVYPRTHACTGALFRHAPLHQVDSVSGSGITSPLGFHHHCIGWTPCQGLRSHETPGPNCNTVSEVHIGCHGMALCSQ